MIDGCFEGIAMKKLQWLFALLIGAWLIGPPAQSAIYTPMSGDDICLDNNGYYSYSIHLGLKYNREGLLNKALAVSNPESSEYGHYLNNSEVAAAFGGSQAAANAVADYFSEQQGSNIRIHPSRLGVTGEVSKFVAVASFCTDIDNPYKSEFCIPHELQEYVEQIAVTPFCRLPTEEKAYGEREESTEDVAESACPEAQQLVSKQVFLPGQMAQATGLEKFYQSGFSGKGGRLAILLSQQIPDSQSVALYKKCFSINIPYHVYSGTPYSFPQFDAVEPQLDVEIALSTAPELDELTFFSTGYDFEGTETVWLLTQALDDANYRKGLPHVLSISQGASEVALSEHELKLAEVYLQLAAVMGITVVAAAGDYGYLNSFYIPTSLGAVFPATSPWVTGVGGTTVTLDNQNQISTEVVWNNPKEGGASGGGPSTLYPRPDWQVGSNSSKAFIGTMRLTPDIAFIGDESYIMVQTQNWIPVGGTSASTPYIAAGIALLNSVLATKGQPAVGFINPLLYNISNTKAYPTVFYDVVNGTSNGNGSLSPAAGGATQGFDRATGLGSIRFDQLAEYLLQASWRKAEPSRN